MEIQAKTVQEGGRNFWLGQKIRLRALEQQDLDAALTATEEPDTELQRAEDAIGLPLSRQAEHDNLQNVIKEIGQNDYLYCLIENRQGQIVGHINSFDCVRRNGTFKYALVIKHPFWRKGYGREAVSIFLRYFFYELRYQKCTALVYGFNEQSIRFHERLGFKFEGRLRNMLYTNGQYFDEIYFGITLAEWKQIDPPLVVQDFKAQGEGQAK